MGLAIANTVATWGTLDSFTNDASRWYHEVDRVAKGETPYADFYWAYAPGAIWLLGAVTRLFGSDVFVILSVMLCVLLGIAVIFARIMHAVVRSWAALLPAAAAFILALAHARPPLGTGTYTPAAPIGFLALSGAVVLTLRLFDRPGTITAFAAGSLSAIALGSRHDLAIASAVVIATGALVCWQAGFPAARRASFAVIAAFAVTLTVLVIAIASTGGWSNVTGVVTGFGQVQSFAGRALPTMQKLLIEVAAALFLLALVFASLVAARAIDRRRGRNIAVLFCSAACLLAIMHIVLVVRVASPSLTAEETAGSTTRLAMQQFGYSFRGLLRGSVIWTGVQLEEHQFPFVLPPILLLVLAARWRRWSAPAWRNRVAFVLAVAVAARLRRGFEFVEWHNFLLETPGYVGFVALVVGATADRQFRHALLIMSTVMLAVSAYTYWHRGIGPATASGPREVVQTARGSIRLLPARARLYRQIDSTLSRIDPTGVRPLFAIGAASGMNYFFDRSNPTPLTQGFRHWVGAHEEVVERLQLQSPILIDHPFHEYILEPVTTGSLLRWDFEVVARHFLEIDRPLFERVAENCRRAGQILSSSIVFYDCVPAARRATTTLVHD